MIRELWALSANTLTQAIRQPVYGVLLILGVLLLIINPLFSAYTLEDDNKLLIDIGLSTVLLGGLLLGAFVASAIFHQELERRTALTVISKPVPRGLFILGKFLGIAASLAAAHWIWSIVFLLTLRHRVPVHAYESFDMPVIAFGSGAAALGLIWAIARNYRGGRSFTASLVKAWGVLLPLGGLLVTLFSKHWELQSPLTEINAQVLATLFLLLEAVILLAAVAVAAATRLRRTPTLIVSTFVFLLALSSDYLFGRFAAHHVSARVAASVIPNLHYLWLADEITQGIPIDATYFVLVTAYSLLVTAGLVAVSVMLFQTREIP